MFKNSFPCLKSKMTTEIQFVLQHAFLFQQHCYSSCPLYLFFVFWINLFLEAYLALVA